MEKDYTDWRQVLGGAIETLASRPQKNVQDTFTTTTNTPYALSDMIANRDRIRNSSKELDDVLKMRETTAYSLANALANIPQQQGYGSWLSGFARALGGGMSAPMNARVARAQAARENELKDLETILAYDKEMGSTQTQSQHQTIGYDDKGGKQTTQQVPILTPNYWEQMISNFDERRKTESAYRNMSQIHRNLRNKVMIAGTPEENYARNQFAAAKGREFLPIARNALKGAGQITDFEDKKYTDWLNVVNDPVELKDTAVRIVDDIAIKNGWTPQQKAEGLRLLGLQSSSENLLEQQKQYEPERIKAATNNVDNILKKFGAKRIAE